MWFSSPEKSENGGSLYGRKRSPSVLAICMARGAGAHCALRTYQL